MNGRAKFAPRDWSIRFLLLRRLVQLSVLLAFISGPWFGIWVLKGNLSSSELLDLLPLSDPLLLLQSLAAGHWPEYTALIGAGIVLLFYLLVGGRVFCSWVCPINMLTDGTAYLRRKWGLQRSGHLDNRLRYWLLLVILLVPLLTGLIIWEWVNPVSLLPRGLIFGMGAGWLLLIGIVLFDLFVVERGWCGHLCPVGAFYALLNKCSPWRVRASRREACTRCMDCMLVCPEPEILKDPLGFRLRKGQDSTSPVVNTSTCTNCGRCIDVCAENVFEFSARLKVEAEKKQ